MLFTYFTPILIDRSCPTIVQNTSQFHRTCRSCSSTVTVVIRRSFPMTGVRLSHWITWLNLGESRIIVDHRAIGDGRDLLHACLLRPLMPDPVGSASCNYEECKASAHETRDETLSVVMKGLSDHRSGTKDVRWARGGKDRQHGAPCSIRHCGNARCCRGKRWRDWGCAPEVARVV